MSEHTIRLPESLYRSLLAAAQAKGLTPASWIASQLSTSAVTSTEETHATVEFSEDLTELVNSVENHKGASASNLNEALNQTAVDDQSRPLSELLVDAGLSDEIAHSPSRVAVKKDDAFGDAL